MAESSRKAKEQQEEEKARCGGINISPLPSPEVLERLDLSPVNGTIDSEAAVDNYIKKNKESIAKSEESLHALQLTMQSLLQQTNARRTDLDCRKDQLRALKQQIEEISLDDIEKEEKELKKLFEDTSLSAQTQEQNAAASARLAELTKEVNFYKRNMGIEIRSCNNTEPQKIIFVFTNIDEDCPNSEYQLSLSVQENGYKYIACEPEIPDIKAMFEKLNDHAIGNIQIFLAEVRAKFIEQTNKENS